MPVSKAPDNFTQAVEEVKQWNKALESSEPNPRTSSGSDNAAASSRYMGGAPAKGPLSLAKPKPRTEAFLTPELAGTLLALHSPSTVLHLRHTLTSSFIHVLT